MSNHCATHSPTYGHDLRTMQAVGIFILFVLFASLPDSSQQVGPDIFKVKRVAQGYSRHDTEVVGYITVDVECNSEPVHEWMAITSFGRSLNRQPITERLGYHLGKDILTIGQADTNVTILHLEICNISHHSIVDLAVGTEVGNVLYKQRFFFQPQEPSRATNRNLMLRHNVTEVVRALPPVTTVETGDEMTLTCSILVPTPQPQYVVVEWTLFKPSPDESSSSDESTSLPWIPRLRSLFLFRKLGETNMETFHSHRGDEYKSEAKLEEVFGRQGGADRAMVSSYLSLAAFDTRDHSGEYSCHMHVDGTALKMTTLVVPPDVTSLFVPDDIRVDISLCDGASQLKPGQSTCVRCLGLGHPSPSLAMYKDFVFLNSTISSEMTWGRPRDTSVIYHMINYPTGDDVGMYTCVARQLASETNSTIVVTLQ